MNSDIVVGRWKQWRGNLWTLWSEWFDSDCAWLEGNNDYLSGILQEDYGLQESDGSTPSANPPSSSLHSGSNQLH